MKPIPGYDGYFADEEGNIWSKKNLIDGKPRKMAIKEGKEGYLRVCLYNDGKDRKRYVHNLVLRAYCGEPLPDQQTRHLNGNKKDNRIVNLAWGTAKENWRDNKRHGTAKGGCKAGPTIKIYPENDGKFDSEVFAFVSSIILEAIWETDNPTLNRVAATLGMNSYHRLSRILTSLGIRDRFNEEMKKKERREVYEIAKRMG